MLTHGCLFQYYHTVTAVRRTDAFKSPMTKVMDLFRHRSNSAVSEADKRKAVSIFYFFQTFLSSGSDNFVFFFGGKFVKLTFTSSALLATKCHYVSVSIVFFWDYF